MILKENLEFVTEIPSGIKEDMIIMRTDGIIKVLRGITSFEEVFGVTKD